MPHKIEKLMERYANGNIEPGVYQLKIGHTYVKKAVRVETDLEEDEDFVEGFLDIDDVDDELFMEYETVGLHSFREDR